MQNEQTWWNLQLASPCRQKLDDAMLKSAHTASMARSALGMPLLSRRRSDSKCDSRWGFNRITERWLSRAWPRAGVVFQRSPVSV